MKRHFTVIEHRGCDITYEIKSGLTMFQAQYLANKLAKNAPLNGDGYAFTYTVEGGNEPYDHNGLPKRQLISLNKKLEKMGLKPIY